MTLPEPLPAAPVGPDVNDGDDTAELERSWRGRGGFIGWLAAVDHKSIARRYLVTAFVFFVFGGIEAMMMRLQLSRPENQLISADLYRQLFSTHGTTMMFLFAVPVMTAVGLYVIPLMVGTRNVAFPRLNAFGYWVYLIGGLLLYTGLLVGSGPDDGWFSYVPLAGPEYSPGKRADVWAQTVTFTEIAAIVGAVELIATILRMRAPGMTLWRLPLFAWSILVTSFMIMFAMPTVATASLFLALDRLVSTRFFDPVYGGDALLWQHLFWFFGHPEVYIIFLPALGMVSSIVETFTRRPIVGYPVMVMSLVATGMLAFGLWVHHMFATPVPRMAQSFFTAASMMIAIPTGAQIFCWIATIWTGRPRLTTPLLFVLGFVILFLIGGLTGVMVASVPFDLQAHDSFFVVAHLHYVLIGGAVFPLLGGIWYWFPKLRGRLLDERLGRLAVALLFIGVNLTFFPMHVLGLDGMTRRIYSYLEETGWGPLNALATAGGMTIASGLLVYLFALVAGWRRGPLAGDDPWGSSTLEWATSSPPPPYNFAYIPVVEGREPLWSRDARRPFPVVGGMRTDRPEVLVTTALAAHPVYRHEHPRDTVWPLAMAGATGVAFIVSIFTPWGVVIGLGLAAVAAIGWGWPRREPDRPDYTRPAREHSTVRSAA